MVATTPASTLVIGPAWVGDMVMAQPLFKLIKQRLPDSRLDVLAPSATFPLLERMPEVDHGVLSETDHGEFKFGYRMNLGEKLRGFYDRAIVLPNSFKSALIPLFADIPERVGYRGEYRYFLLNDIRLQSKRRPKPMIEVFAALSQPAEKQLKLPLPIPSLSTDEDQQQQLLTRFGLHSEMPIVGLCSGAAFGDAKRWPPAHYAELARAQVDAGRQVWLFGSAGDMEAASEIMSLVNHSGCTDLTGKTSLTEAIDLISLCNLIVTNDSGLMHVACATGVPTIAIYGSTSPGFTPPLSEQAEIISLELDCSPCFKRTCPLGHTNCLNQLSPERVLAMSEQWMNR